MEVAVRRRGSGSRRHWRKGRRLWDGTIVRVPFGSEELGKMVRLRGERDGERVCVSDFTVSRSARWVLLVGQSGDAGGCWSEAGRGGAVQTGSGPRAARGGVAGRVGVVCWTKRQACATGMTNSPNTSGARLASGEQRERRRSSDEASRADGGATAERDGGRA